MAHSEYHKSAYASHATNTIIMLDIGSQYAMSLDIWAENMSYGSKLN